MCDALANSKPVKLPPRVLLCINLENQKKQHAVDSSLFLHQTKTEQAKHNQQPHCRQQYIDNYRYATKNFGNADSSNKNNSGSSSSNGCSSSNSSSNGCSSSSIINDISNRNDDNCIIAENDEKRILNINVKESYNPIKTDSYYKLLYDLMFNVVGMPSKAYYPNYLSYDSRLATMASEQFRMYYKRQIAEAGFFLKNDSDWTVNDVGYTLVCFYCGGSFVHRFHNKITNFWHLHNFYFGNCEFLKLNVPNSLRHIRQAPSEFIKINKKYMTSNTKIPVTPSTTLANNSFSYKNTNNNIHHEKLIGSFGRSSLSSPPLPPSSSSSSSSSSSILPHFSPYILPQFLDNLNNNNNAGCSNSVTSSNSSNSSGFFDVPTTSKYSKNEENILSESFYSSYRRTRDFQVDDSKLSKIRTDLIPPVRDKKFTCSKLQNKYMKRFYSMRPRSHFTAFVWSMLKHCNNDAFRTDTLKIIKSPSVEEEIKKLFMNKQLIVSLDNLNGIIAESLSIRYKLLDMLAEFKNDKTNEERKTHLQNEDNDIYENSFYEKKSHEQKDVSWGGHNVHSDLSDDNSLSCGNDCTDDECSSDSMDRYHENTNGKNEVNLFCSENIYKSSDDDSSDLDLLDFIEDENSNSETNVVNPSSPVIANELLEQSSDGLLFAGVNATNDSGISSQEMENRNLERAQWSLAAGSDEIYHRKDMMDKIRHVLKSKRKIRKRKSRTARISKRPPLVSTSTSESSSSGANLCKICYENLLNVLYHPCNHLVVCDSCHQQSEKKSCIICRQKILFHTKVYLS